MNDYKFKIRLTLKISIEKLKNQETKNGIKKKAQKEPGRKHAGREGGREGGREKVRDGEKRKKNAGIVKHENKASEENEQQTTNQ